MNDHIKGLLPSTMMQGFIQFMRMKGYHVSAVNAGNALAALNALGRPVTFIRARGVARSVFAYDADSWREFIPLWNEYWLSIAASSKIEANSEAGPGEQEWMIYDLSPDEMKLLQSRLESETSRLESETNTKDESQIKDRDLEEQGLKQEAGQTRKDKEGATAKEQEQEGVDSGGGMRSEKNFAGNFDAEQEALRKGARSSAAQGQPETRASVSKQDSTQSTEASSGCENKQQGKGSDRFLASQSREDDLANSRAGKRSAEASTWEKDNNPSKDHCSNEGNAKESSSNSNEAEKRNGKSSAKGAENKSDCQTKAKDGECNELANAADREEKKQSEAAALSGQEENNGSEEEGDALNMETQPNASTESGEESSQAQLSDATDASGGGSGHEQGAGDSIASAKGMEGQEGRKNGGHGGRQMMLGPAGRGSATGDMKRSRVNQSGSASNAQEIDGAGSDEGFSQGATQGNAMTGSFAGQNETGIQQVLNNAEGKPEDNEGLSNSASASGLAQSSSSEGAEGQRGIGGSDGERGSRSVEGERPDSDPGTLPRGNEPMGSSHQATSKASMNRENATSLDIAQRNARNYTSLLQIASKRSSAKKPETDNVLSMMTRLTLAIDRMTDSERKEGYRGELLDDKSMDTVLKGMDLSPGHPPVQGGLYGQGNYGNIIDGLDNVSDCRRVRNLARQVALALRFRPSRRYEHSRRGRILDCRKTIRKSLETGGDFYELAYRKRKDQRTRITTLLDVSGSMMNYYKFLLYFTQGLISGGLRPESLIFNTRLRCVTELMRKRDLERAAKRMPLGGGTLIASSLEGMLKYHGGRFLGDHVSLFIISDGWDGEHSDRLSEAIGKLRPHTRNIVWLTPQSDRNMWPAALSLAEEKMDLVSSISSIQDMKELVKKLKRIK